MASEQSSDFWTRLRPFPDGWFDRLADMSLEERLPAMRELVNEYLEINQGYIVPGQMLQIVQALAEGHGREFSEQVREWRAKHGIAA